METLKNKEVLYQQLWPNSLVTRLKEINDSTGNYTLIKIKLIKTIDDEYLIIKSYFIDLDIINFYIYSVMILISLNIIRAYYNRKPMFSFTFLF